MMLWSILMLPLLSMARTYELHNKAWNSKENRWMDPREPAVTKRITKRVLMFCARPEVEAGEYTIDSTPELLQNRHFATLLMNQILTYVAYCLLMPDTTTCGLCIKYFCKECPPLLLQAHKQSEMTWIEYLQACGVKKPTMPHIGSHLDIDNLHVDDLSEESLEIAGAFQLAYPNASRKDTIAFAKLTALFTNSERYEFGVPRKISSGWREIFPHKMTWWEKYEAGLFNRVITTLVILLTVILSCMLCCCGRCILALCRGLYSSIANLVGQLSRLTMAAVRLTGVFCGHVVDFFDVTWTSIRPYLCILQIKNNFIARQAIQIEEKDATIAASDENVQHLERTVESLKYEAQQLTNAHREEVAELKQDLKSQEFQLKKLRTKPELVSVEIQTEHPENWEPFEKMDSKLNRTYAELRELTKEIEHLKANNSILKAANAKLKKSKKSYKKRLGPGFHKPGSYSQMQAQFSIPQNGRPGEPSVATMSVAPEPDLGEFFSD